MRYVIIRDDDTNALTPIECLERLYRPFFDRGLPVNLAAIPSVSTSATRADGAIEGFLPDRKKDLPEMLPLGVNEPLVRYLRGNPGFHIVQHGFNHTFNEFDNSCHEDIACRLEQGAKRLMEAGFPRPETFVAPYDQLSPASLREVTKRFSVLSTGWFELRRLPRTWWPFYLLKKARQKPHWRIGPTVLLTHPGCLLSCYRPTRGILPSIQQVIGRQRLTVLVTHWWEYFRQQQPNEAFIRVLHETADWLSRQPDLEVISFADLAQGCRAI